MKVFTFDSTLRDGTQGEGILLSVNDKLAITRKLDELGIDYVEGGWPGSNPNDKEFFLRARELKLNHTRLTAFGSTRLAKNSVQDDPSVVALADAGTPAVSIFGKSWGLHVVSALGITLAENLTLISETVRFLKEHSKEVIYDAEHFFDGYKADRDYALRTLEAAKQARADVLCLCDTNGGTLAGQLAEIVSEVRKRFDGVIGIYTHNDSDLAVANALVAVESGATLVQGCINGYGKRCGSANLASIIANLELKMGHTTIGPGNLSKLSSTCQFIAELANLAVRNEQPFVGKSAFAHKGGVHGAVLKNSATFEHIPPESVGNCRRVLVSDLSGRANIVYKLKEHGLGTRLDDEKGRALLVRIKQMEYEGYDLETADGTFELLVRQALHPEENYFEVSSYEVRTGAAAETRLATKAHIVVRANGLEHSASLSGKGPFHALHRCLRTCLAKPYPEMMQVHMKDYKVRLLDSGQGTASKVRVLIEWSDNVRSWSTVGVSSNVVEASWSAMLDAVRLELMRLRENRNSAKTLHSTQAT